MADRRELSQDSEERKEDMIDLRDFRFNISRDCRSRVKVKDTLDFQEPESVSQNLQPFEDNILVNQDNINTSGSRGPEESSASENLNLGVEVNEEQDDNVIS